MILMLLNTPHRIVARVKYDNGHTYTLNIVWHVTCEKAYYYLCESISSLRKLCKKLKFLTVHCQGWGWLLITFELVNT